VIPPANHLGFYTQYITIIARCNYKKKKMAQYRAGAEDYTAGRNKAFYGCDEKTFKKLTD
jgi:hypothetical protein